MELKSRTTADKLKPLLSFNRTAYGIEISSRVGVIDTSDTFNRTAYGIEIGFNPLWISVVINF